MLLFYSTGDAHIRLRAPDHRIDLRAHPRGSMLSSSHVYCTTNRTANIIGSWLAEHGPQGVLRWVSADQAAATFTFPPYLGGTTPGVRAVPALAAILGERRPGGRAANPCLGVFNGFGSGIGDTIVGLTALRCAREYVVAQGGPAFTADLIVNPDVALRIAPLARIDPLVNRLVSLPQTMSAIQKYDGLWDFDGYLLDPRVNDTPMVDYYLDRLGVAPALVDPGAKNNRLRLPRAPKKLEAALARLPGRMLLFHPKASADVRSMPDVHARRIVSEILQLTDYTVATVIPMDFAHPRFVNLAPHCAGLLDLCQIVARAGRIVTVDTCVYHLAAAFGVATVALFTTIAPELRVKYYPSVAGILLDGAERTPYFGVHMDKRELPPESVFALWDRFDVGLALRELESRAAAGPPADATA